MRRALAVLFLAGGLTTPALTAHAALKDKAAAELAALAAFAGYVTATVKFCGGDAQEADYFTSIVRKWVVGAGAEPGEWLDFLSAMGEARQTAEPRARDCTDEGGLENATKLDKLRAALVAATAK